MVFIPDWKLDATRVTRCESSILFSSDFSLVIADSFVNCDLSISQLRTLDAIEDLTVLGTEAFQNLICSKAFVKSTSGTHAIRDRVNEQFECPSCFPAT